jgi:excisionase family DNA binding protein
MRTYGKEPAMTVTSTEPRLYRASEAARILRVHPRRIRELVASGQLRSVRLEGTGWHRIPAEEVERLIAGEEPD